ncbi:hypothetical protein [Lacinutrix jangbogonensis]|uniref:hypothetical protein n=1 Tax=Lacinutrix jangbogonensis TaxID=1469557 RepID=UPI00053F03BA|nr:hypothetical protein [Lacinutrix jangbogonensis]
MTLIDFIIGALLANAMPHLIFGLTKTHFLGMFGYSPKANILYAIIQFILCIILFYLNYGYKDLMENGYLIGGITVLGLYFIFGRFLVKFYGKKK